MRKLFNMMFESLEQRRSARYHRISGFTLIELMVVVVIVAIFAAIAIPSYQRYIEKRDLAVAKQEAQRIATELERFKSKNFSYKGFNPSYLYSYNSVDAEDKPVVNSYYNASTGELLLPVGSTSTNAKYILTLLDAGEKRPLSSGDIAEDKDKGTAASTIRGLNWVMSVERAKDEDGEPKQPNNYDLLLTNTGLRCMSKTNKAFDDYDISENTHTACSGIDSASEVW